MGKGSMMRKEAGEHAHERRERFSEYDTSKRETFGGREEERKRLTQSEEH